jgi:hypothetical protein
VNFWAPARLLSLDGRRFACTIRHFGAPLWTTPPSASSEHVWLADRRGDRDVGVVCTTTSPREGGANERLSDNLPGWLLRDTF